MAQPDIPKDYYLHFSRQHACLLHKTLSRLYVAPCGSVGQSLQLAFCRMDTADVDLLVQQQLSALLQGAKF